MSDAARLLDVIAAAAQRGEDLAAALRACGLPGAAAAAERLQAGASVPQAVTGLLPPATAALLGGALPPLGTVAALLADEAWRALERRRLVCGHVAYPLAAGVLVAVGAVLLARLLPPGPYYAPVVAPGWAVAPAALAALLLAAPWLPRAWRLPGAGWVAHLDRAERWARAGLAARWRLSEAQAQQLLGVDLAPFAALLGTPGADEHCRRLAEWHRRAAWRRLAVTARAAAAALLLAGGGLVLASIRVWQGGA